MGVLTEDFYVPPFPTVSLQTLITAVDIASLFSIDSKSIDPFHIVSVDSICHEPQHGLWWKYRH